MPDFNTIFWDKREFELMMAELEADMDYCIKQVGPVRPALTLPASGGETPEDNPPGDSLRIIR